MAGSRDNHVQQRPLLRPRRGLLVGVVSVVILVIAILMAREGLWSLLAQAVGTGVMAGVSVLVIQLSPLGPHSWRSIALGIVRILTALIVAFGIAYPFLKRTAFVSSLITSFFLLALFAASLAYLFYVSAHVRLDFPGINALVAKNRDSHTARDQRANGTVDSTVQEGVRETIQVSRLSTSGARISIANDSSIPVLRAQMVVTLVREEEDGKTPNEGHAQNIKSEAFSIPAHSVYPTAIASVFNHVGIFTLRSEGVRVYGPIGLLSRTGGARGQWRVRVVPNIYRLTRGIPRARNASQESLGIPDAPADALDYDRVRDYRPGDPLKTIHWKLVAHGQGELYTKLFETPTVSSATLIIDPLGPDFNARTLDAAYHMHDTMLEGGFSLIEHARESGIPGRLLFVNRSGALIETRWEGLATLGWFVETARRPSHTQEALEQSVLSIQSLRDNRPGYTIFATSRLASRTVEALIACRHSGIPLLVLHAQPSATSSASKEQLAYDSMLREASIDVIGLTDGPQIIREVSTP